MHGLPGAAVVMGGSWLRSGSSWSCSRAGMAAAAIASAPKTTARCLSSRHFPMAEMGSEAWERDQGRRGRSSWEPSRSAASVDAAALHSVSWGGGGE